MLYPLSTRAWEQIVAAHRVGPAAAVVSGCSVSGSMVRDGSRLTRQHGLARPSGPASTRADL